MIDRDLRKAKGLDGDQSIPSTTPGIAGQDGAEQGVERNRVLESNIEQPWLQPPSVEQIKQELQTPRISRNYEQQYARNRKEAIKQILQENVVKNTSVRDSKLRDKFNEGKGGE